MEAVPKLQLISFELKVSPENTHFGPKLKQYISEAYREDPDSYGNEMHQLEGLRSTAVRPTMDTSGLNALIKYFCQLRSMQSRFPMAKGQPAACTFAWKDLYANMTCSLADLKFEMACILYNIGALHTQLGSAEPRNTPDSLKSCCQHYQYAAWAFEHLREQFPQPPGADVCAEIVRLLQEICFAQAQECILDKSIQDTRKSSVIGAVATQVLFFYKSCLALLGPSNGSDNIHEIVGPKLYDSWYNYVSFKIGYIGCIVCLYQGINAEEQQKMGERVAFYQTAVERLADARKLAKYIEPKQLTLEALTFTNDVVEGKRKAAKNENEFIYHEEVPEKDMLTDLKPVCLVKAVPINFNDPTVAGSDIFSRLVPMGAHEASSMYSEEKAKLLRHVISQTDAKNTELTEFMSSLQLDQLEVLDTDHKIPQDIVDRCAAMNAKTDIIQTLVDSMNTLAEIIGDVEHSLSEIKSLIQEETLKEKEYQKQMGPRPPSIVQTEISREYHKYQEAHLRTNESNQVLHKAMTLHIANLRLLSQPLDVLEHKIPSIENIEGLDRDTMAEMRRVVGKSREMQRQRDSLLQQLREALAADDVTAQLLARPTEQTEDIFKAELEKHTPTVKIIEQNLAAQENIINRLTSLYASYGDSRRLLSEVLRKREGLINALITSYDSHAELLGKSQKGLEFYKKLAHNVNGLLARLRSVCQVQREERASMMARQEVPKPATSTVSKALDSAPTPSSGGGLKLKDYLPYMKNKGLPKNTIPQVTPEPLPADKYYVPAMYPTSVRPPPVGSEATDLTPTNVPDGVVMSMHNAPNSYVGYAHSYAPHEADPYSHGASYSMNKFNKPEENIYSSYTPPQYSTPMVDPQIYSSPYYAATNNTATLVTESQDPTLHQTQNVAQPPHQYNQYNSSYMMNPVNVMPDVVTSMYNPQSEELNSSFAQMQISGPKQETQNVQDYSQTYYSVQYPQMYTSDTQTYSSAGQKYNTNITRQLSNEYTANYPQVAPNVSNASYNLGESGISNAYPNTYNQIPNISAPSSSYSYSNVPQISNAMNVPQISNTMNMPQISNTMNMPQISNAMNVPIPNVSNTYTNGNDQNPINGNPMQGMNSYPNMVQGAVVSNAYPVPNIVNPTNNIPNSNMPNVDTSNAYNVEQQYTYSNPYDNTSQGYVYGQNVVTSTTNANAMTFSVGQSLNTPNDTMPYTDPNFTQIDAMDKPIKSHVTGEALVGIPNVVAYSSDPSTKQTNQPTNVQYPDQSQMSYAQSYQNHPGYTYNPVSGGYDYNYGSQNSYTGYDSNHSNLHSQSAAKDPSFNAHGVYSNAGAYDTLQSPSENAHQMQPTNVSDEQIYYNLPYGYQTVTNQSFEVSQSLPTSTNYGANMNNSTYMQSSQNQESNVTYTSNQVAKTYENISEPIYVKQEQNSDNNDLPEIKAAEEISVPEVIDPRPGEHKEPSTFDLLSEIDFTVDERPLMPDIKVPQISEKAIIKPNVVSNTPMEPIKRAQVEEKIERPPKKDLFKDPSLLNRFTQQVKELQRLTDSLGIKTPTGLTLLESKWKTYQDVQLKENVNRSKKLAIAHTADNIVTAVVPYDDSRLMLKSEPDAYLNATHYKQLSPWCIPLVIAKCPEQREAGVFWRAVHENRVACVVCLQTEIEMQGEFYWPTAKGQSLEFGGGAKVTLEGVTCNVHWTERKLRIDMDRSSSAVVHYQINVYPAKVVCSPLVLLADHVLNATYEGRGPGDLAAACLQCATGAGRSAAMALLLVTVCEVRAGCAHLIDILDEACSALCKHRTNVLEDPRFLADAYRTALFYAQGVLCSGTTMFNGEAVSVPSGAAVLPPVPTPVSSGSSHRNKFSRESFEEMKQSAGLKSGDMKDPLNFLDPLWSLKKK